MKEPVICSENKCQLNMFCGDFLGTHYRWITSNSQSHVNCCSTTTAGMVRKAARTRAGGTTSAPLVCGAHIDTRPLCLGMVCPTVLCLPKAMRSVGSMMFSRRIKHSPLKPLEMLLPTLYLNSFTSVLNSGNWQIRSPAAEERPPNQLRKADWFSFTRNQWHTIQPAPPQVPDP